jgi:hypothetical protein
VAGERTAAGWPGGQGEEAPLLLLLDTCGLPRPVKPFGGSPAEAPFSAALVDRRCQGRNEAVPAWR